MTQINSVLVANRGEIARRVFRTAREMGIRTTAIHVDADAGAPFVREADVAVRVESYMDVEAVVAAAKATGSEAIHPGYGFLSENAGFAQAVAAAGIMWLGPSPDVIAAMGDKLEAKRRAVAAGVPTLPSTEDPTAGDEIGYPLLVKAAAGGGGKGMRIVDAADELAESVAAAQREALGGFGDDTVFLERYVPRSRHVEIQIMGDTHGTVVDHGERECSIQRRHQKIVEEAPSPGIDDTTRKAMADAAVELGREMGYVSAGTVEFLVDDDSGDFYFLEVNTRLQVEHPVTEEARGIDLVREQFRVAMGEALTPGASAATHAAIEVRLYAEDPANDFLPAIGTVEAFTMPDDGSARWDVGVEAGSEVTIDFDPMIGKVIAKGPDRPEAARRLATALERLHLGGVVTNRDFLVAVLRSAEFLAGDTTTDFIDRVRPATGIDLGEDGLETAMFVGALWLQGRNRSRDPWWASLPVGFRNGRLPPTTATFTASGLPEDSATRTVAYEARRGGGVALGSGADALRNEEIEAIALDTDARVLAWAPDAIEVQIGGVRQRHLVTARADAAGPADGIDRLWIQMPTGTVELTVAPKFVIPGAAELAGGFSAPMPGKVLEVRVAAGDAVARGQTLVVLEAMKMEQHMTAAEDGVVGEVLVVAGQQVAKDEVLLTMADDGADDGVDEEGQS
ncbi:MAG: biotin carboxylase N-terminal domain-containing protein [Actinomycetota bacterium]